MEWLLRPTATPRRVAPWLGELARTAPGLFDAWLPTAGGIGPRTREKAILVISEVNGCRYTAWVHAPWSDLLGEDGSDEQLPAVMAYARESAIAGSPSGLEALYDALPTDAARATRATVAMAELSTLAGNTVDAWAARLTGRQPLAPLAFVRETATVAIAVPLAAPAFALAAAMRLANRLSPPMPEIEQPEPDDANLVVHMLAEAVPAYLGNAIVRAAVLRLPRRLNIGFRAEGTEATLRISRDRVVLENGLGDDTFLVVDGGLELLLDVASRAISRELSDLTLRRFR